jgi:hypothetical protein
MLIGLGPIAVKELAIAIHANRLVPWAQHTPPLETELPPVLSEVEHLCIYCRDGTNDNNITLSQWEHLPSFAACFPRLRHLDVENIGKALEDRAPRFVKEIVEYLLEIESVKIQGIGKTLVDWCKC